MLQTGNNFMDTDIYYISHIINIIKILKLINVYTTGPKRNNQQMMTYEDIFYSLTI